MQLVIYEMNDVVRSVVTTKKHCVGVSTWNSQDLLPALIFIAKDVHAGFSSNDADQLHPLLRHQA